MSQTNVRIIKANPFNFKNEGTLGKHLLRVAAYARVSTDSDEQEDSFDRQVSYYTNYIQGNKDWEFVKVYSDPGISGTKAESRPGFMEMMEDCRKGKIDRILVKSIARFARNTVDALKYIRELKELGISVYFEAHNLDTGTNGGEVLLTILAATAEEESRTISKNIKWTYQKKFERGEFVFNYSWFLGLTKTENGWEIVEEEAEIVRRIYREFLCGASYQQIARGLNADGIKSPSGKGKYSASVIKSILTNEKYYGACVMGKTFKPDVLSKKRYKNTGQVDLYYVENALPAIVSKETWDMVQFEMKQRDENMGVSNKVYGKFSSSYPFSKIIRCGCCGGLYIRNKNMRGKGHNIPAWCCGNHFYHSDSCPQKGISEESIKRAFVKVINEIAENIIDVKSLVAEAIRNSLVNSPKQKPEEIELEIIKLQEEMLELHKRKTKGLVDPKEYAVQGQALAEKIDLKKKLLDDVKSKSILTEITAKRMSEIESILETLKHSDDFDEYVFRQMVDTITITDRTKITFKFKIGIEKTIEATIK